MPEDSYKDFCFRARGLYRSQDLFTESAKLPLGIFSKTFSLGAGEKGVCLYLPYSMKTVIRELSLDDGAAVETLKRSRRLRAYGDSITQGFDALRPAQKYTTRLAEHLNAKAHNRGISGACFFLDLLGQRSLWTRITSQLPMVPTAGISAPGKSWYPAAQNSMTGSVAGTRWRKYRPFPRCGAAITASTGNLATLSRLKQR